MKNFNLEVAMQIGEFLKKKREDRKVDLQKVGEITFISPIYLEALEKGEWDKLPGRTYVSGYLKIYSRFLGLDTKELLSLFNQAYEEPKEKVILLSEKKLKTGERNILRFLVATFAILTVLFVFILISYRLPIFSKLTPGEGITTSVEETSTQEESPSPEATPDFSVVVVLQAEKLSWAEVRSGETMIFSGILVPDKSYIFKSNTPFVVSGKNGNRIRVNFNGNDLGYLSSEDGDFERTFGP